MKRTTSIAIVAGATLSALGASAAAAGSSGPSSITIHLSSKLEHVKYVDNPPAGPSAGDDLIFTERLLDAHGRTIGSDAASCISLFDQRSLCTGTYVLAAGQIMVQLLQPGPTGTYAQAITGGTGSYARATGTVTVAQGSGGDHFTFHVYEPAR